MRKFGLLVFSVLFLTFSSCDLDDRESEKDLELYSRIVNITPVSTANILPNNSRIMLEGHIVGNIYGEYFTFQDSSGQMIVEIESKVWQAAFLNSYNVIPDVPVTILGKLERERNTTKIEVKIIRKATSSNVTDKPTE